MMNRLEVAARQALEALISAQADEHRDWAFEYLGMVIAALREALAARQVVDDAKDAERYRWLKSRMMGADFDWNESGACALVFEWPRDVPIGADCDRNIDCAIEAAQGIKGDSA